MPLYCAAMKTGFCKTGNPHRRQTTLPTPSAGLTATGLSVQSGRTAILRDITFSLAPGESMAITGTAGSGKTTLGRILAGQQLPTSGRLTVAPNLRRLMIQQQDHFFALAGQRSTYYGQRYENQGMDDCPTVREYLSKTAADTSERIDAVLKEMEIEQIADRKLLQLSNGERKRTQLAEALLQQPDLLVLDQPFTGLDTRSRGKLALQLRRQMENGICLIVICDPESIPDCIHWILELDHGQVRQFTARERYIPRADAAPAENDEADDPLFEFLPPPDESFSEIVSMRNVCVQLNGKQILDGITWQIKPGEQWALQGPNGAGKSTLLSLITADNPQGYTNDLILFDRQRGSGESIWDIKRRIGFVSPELHLYFLRGSGIFNTIPGLDATAHEVYDSLTCMEVITSGFQDEIGFSSPADDHQLRIARTWLSILKLEHLRERLFIHASLGEQRALLLARALVKSPSLLILDEPCQGMDSGQIKRFVHLLDRICIRLHTTMIYVTHREEEIPPCVARRFVLQNGRHLPA